MFPFDFIILEYFTCYWLYYVSVNFDSPFYIFDFFLVSNVLFNLFILCQLTPYIDTDSFDVVVSEPLNLRDPSVHWTVNNILYGGVSSCVFHYQTGSYSPLVGLIRIR
jgi:hypothetical protein